MKVVAAFVLAVIAFNAVVLPNAQQALLAAFMLFGAIIAVLYLRRFPVVLVGMLIVSWIVTIFYIFVGTLQGAPATAAIQAIIIYIVSPLIWLLVIDLSWRLFGVDRIVRAFAVLGLTASASVAVYMYLFLNFGPQSVWFFGSNANVHLEEGYSGVIMHVSGSLIFLGAAFVAEPGATQTRMLGLLALLGLVLAAIASGRTAAILALSVGGIFFVLVSGRQMRAQAVVWFLVLALLGPFVAFSMDFLLGVDVLKLLDRHWAKVQHGDVERPAQIAALFRGIEQNWFLGSGHGIGVEYLRSTEFPWRYEAVFVALVFKTGLVGSIVVLFPILYALSIFLASVFFGKIQRHDVFFGAALVACFLAGFTNPYLEAFSFQWMYLVPTYYFLRKRLTGVSAGKRTLGSGPIDLSLAA